MSPDGRRLALKGDASLDVTTTDLDELIEIAQARITRELTDQECQTYLHVQVCPTG